MLGVVCNTCFLVTRIPMRVLLAKRTQLVRTQVICVSINIRIEVASLQPAGRAAARGFSSAAATRHPKSSIPEVSFSGSLRVFERLRCLFVRCNRVSDNNPEIVGKHIFSIRPAKKNVN